MIYGITKLKSNWTFLRGGGEDLMQFK